MYIYLSWNSTNITQTKHMAKMYIVTYCFAKYINDILTTMKSFKCDDFNKNINTGHIYLLFFPSHQSFLSSVCFLIQIRRLQMEWSHLFRNQICRKAWWKNKPDYIVVDSWLRLLTLLLHLYRSRMPNVLRILSVL